MRELNLLPGLFLGVLRKLGGGRGGSGLGLSIKILFLQIPRLQQNVNSDIAVGRIA